MRRPIPITEARTLLTTLPDELAAHPGTVTVTRRGKPVLAILSWELYESIMETMEIMADEELMASLRRSIQEVKEGKLIPLEEVEAELDAQKASTGADS